jgi:outer membrane protein OmpA-like peptidoglycan-associated protein
VAITGHTDNDGSDSENGPLSNARATVVLSQTRSPALTAMAFTATGVGSTAPLTSGTTEADKQRNRRASFRVTLSDDSGQRSSRP